VEVDTRGWPVSRSSDGKVNSDGEPSYLSAIQSVSGLFSLTNNFEIDESKSSGPFGRTIQDYINFLDLAVLAKLPLQVLLRGGEVETENTKAVGWLRILPVSTNFGWTRKRTGPGTWRS